MVAVVAVVAVVAEAAVVVVACAAVTAAARAFVVAIQIAGQSMQPQETARSTQSMAVTAPVRPVASEPARRRVSAALDVGR